MDTEAVRQALEGSGLTDWRYLEAVDSTNSEARRWLEAGAPDRCLVLADHQYAGRGRQGRSWQTPARAALAASLILREPGTAEQPAAALQLLTGLGAVALADALDGLYGMRVEIKWPNDVLAAGRKIAGVLAEAFWLGDRLEGAVVGIGVNVFSGAVPPAETLHFPAASLQDCLPGVLLDRPALLRELVGKLLAWLPRLGTEEFLGYWESRLAWRGQQVQVLQVAGSPADESTCQGYLDGLDATGKLRLKDRWGKAFLVEVGDLRLRPAG